MKVVILDFTDWKVKIINDLKDNVQIEEVDDILINKYNINISNVEYMIVPELEIETL